MNDIVYVKPTLLEIEKMQELVRDEVEKGTILYRSPDEMATNIRSYTLAKRGDEIVGFPMPLPLLFFSTIRLLTSASLAE